MSLVKSKDKFAMSFKHYCFVCVFHHQYYILLNKKYLFNVLTKYMIYKIYSDTTRKEEFIHKRYLQFFIQNQESIQNFYIYIS